MQPDVKRGAGSQGKAGDRTRDRTSGVGDDDLIVTAIEERNTVEGEEGVGGAAQVRLILAPLIGERKFTDGGDPEPGVSADVGAETERLLDDAGRAAPDEGEAMLKPRGDGDDVSKLRRNGDLSMIVVAGGEDGSVAPQGK